MEMHEPVGNHGSCAALLRQLVEEVRTARHEVANHLAEVVGYAELLLTDAELPAHLREFAAEILHAGEQAAAALVRIRLVER
jgi:hypothetical protein